MHVGKRIRERREQLDIPLGQLAIAAKVDKGNLSRIERDGRGFSHDSLERIARELRTTSSALLNENSHVTNMGVRRLPVWDYTTAPAFVYPSPTPGIKSVTEMEGQRYVLTNLDYPNGTFALEITDDSMAPRLTHGMVAIVDPERPVQPNCVVAVAYMDGKTPMTALRRYRDRGHHDDGSRAYEAAPENPAFRTLSSTDPLVKIVGVLVEHREYW